VLDGHPPALDCPPTPARCFCPSCALSPSYWRSAIFLRLFLTVASFVTTNSSKSTSTGLLFCWSDPVFIELVVAVLSHWISPPCLIVLPRLVCGGSDILYSSTFIINNELKNKDHGRHRHTADMHERTLMSV
jgi:hypothetical protein